MKINKEKHQALDQIGGGKPGPGRKPGIRNKANGLLKDAIVQAAEEAGGRDAIVGYLAQQARKHPAAFLALIGRVLPLQVQGRDTSETDRRRDRALPLLGPRHRTRRRNNVPHAKGIKVSNAEMKCFDIRGDELLRHPRMPKS